MKHTKYLISALVSIILIASSCGSDDDTTPTPPDNIHTRSEVLAKWSIADTVTIAPDEIQWAVNDSTVNLLSTMTLITAAPAEISTTATSDRDLIAVFANDQCLGVSSHTPTAYGNRFMINIYKPHVNTKLTVAYYNATQQLAYYWHNEFYYSEDVIQGHVNAPHALSTAKASLYPHIHTVSYFTPSDIAPLVSANDVIGIFVGNSCRAIIQPSNISKNHLNGTATIGLLHSDELIHVRHFCASNGQIYASTPQPCTLNKASTIIKPERMSQ